MSSVLFVCTGNIFRSLVAEYALKARLGSGSVCLVGSAGIDASPQAVHPLVRRCLIEKGADPSGHVQRRLTPDLLEWADLPIAMGFDHREQIRMGFGRDVLLFNQVCHQREEPVLDIHEAIPDWADNLEAARDYAISTIDYIWNSIPALLENMERLARARGPNGPDLQKSPSDPCAGREK